MDAFSIGDMLNEIILTSVALFIIIDPLGGLPIFAGLLKDMSLQERRRTIHLAVGVSALILLLFSTVGLSVLRLFDVGLEELMVGGGLMLLIVALDEIFGILPSSKIDRSEVGIIPMACPLIAGPGAIVTTMLAIRKFPVPENYLVCIASIALALLPVWGILLCIDRLNRLIGKLGALIMGKLMGIILAAIAVSFIVRGLFDLSARFPN